MNILVNLANALITQPHAMEVKTAATVLTKHRLYVNHSSKPVEIYMKPERKIGT